MLCRLRRTANGPFAGGGWLTRDSVTAWGGMVQVLVNAGQANAATGDQGAEDCTTSAEAVSQALSIPVDQVHTLVAFCN